MITDMPTKDDFYTMADHMVNEAWEKVADLAYDYYNYGESNDFKTQSSYYDDGDLANLENYWQYARPKLITAFTLILQSVEFRLKGLIVEISPYLLITNATKNLPKSDSEGNISFTEFHTLDAQDLLKIYNAFSSVKLPETFSEWFKNMRILRNRFMHTVDKNTDITPEFIFTSVVTAHRYLNSESSHWIWHRYQYKVAHSSGGVVNGMEDKEEFSGTVWEMLNIHYEFTSVISVCSKQAALDFFGYHKISPGDIHVKESFYCKKCVSVMEKRFNFDGKHIESALETVQYNRKLEKYICAFCHDQQDVKAKGIWEECD